MIADQIILEVILGVTAPPVWNIGLYVTGGDPAITLVGIEVPGTRTDIDGLFAYDALSGTTLNSSVIDIIAVPACTAVGWFVANGTTDDVLTYTDFTVPVVLAENDTLTFPVGTISLDAF